MAASDINRIRILVLGDSGTGKTSFVHLACHGTPLHNSPWTVGCSVSVVLHEYGAGTPNEVPYFVEYWDVGGSKSHKDARHIFYNPIHGLILMHDLTNRVSGQNLRLWYDEVVEHCNLQPLPFSPSMAGLGGSASTLGGLSHSSSSSSLNNQDSPVRIRKLTSATSASRIGPAGNVSIIIPSESTNNLFGLAGGDSNPVLCAKDLPILIVATKSDLLVDGLKSPTLTPGFSSNSQDGGFRDPLGWINAGNVPANLAIKFPGVVDEIELNTMDSRALGPGTTNALKLSRFYDLVIGRQYYRGFPVVGNSSHQTFLRR